MSVLDDRARGLVAAVKPALHGRLIGRAELEVGVRQGDRRNRTSDYRPRRQDCGKCRESDELAEDECVDQLLRVPDAIWRYSTVTPSPTAIAASREKPMGDSSSRLGTTVGLPIGKFHQASTL